MHKKIKYDMPQCVKNLQNLDIFLKLKLDHYVYQYFYRTCWSLLRRKIKKFKIILISRSLSLDVCVRVRYDIMYFDASAINHIHTHTHTHQIFVYNSHASTVDERIACALSLVNDVFTRVSTGAVLQIVHSGPEG